MRKSRVEPFDNDKHTKDYRHEQDAYSDIEDVKGWLRIILNIRVLIDDETHHRLRTYQDAGYKLREAARRLNISPSTLHDTIKKFKLDVRELIKLWQSQAANKQSLA